ncbi:MAG: EAL domain-containing protein, partial [Cucumibacter sp.]
MFHSARKALPAVDYVSIVRSLYEDKRSMVQGASATIVASAACAIKTGSPWMMFFTLAFLAVTVGRWLDMTAFQNSDFEPEDVEAAAHWELRYTIGASITAMLLGLWCFVTFAFVKDPVVELMVMSVTVAQMVGVAARNFGVDRLVTLQSAFIVVPLTLGLLTTGNVYHVVLAAMFVPFFMSLRKIAATVRRFLLSALHGRIEATRLAQELDAALDTMQHGLCMLDEDGKVAVVNDRAHQMFSGFAAGSWIGRPFAEMVLTAANVNRALPQHAARSLIENVEKGGTRKLVVHFSEDYQCEVTISSRHGRTVLLFEDITERVRAQERINYMARFDALTGLPNRNFFKERVEADIERWAHGEGRGKSRGKHDAAGSAILMIVDLDDFKHVNDTHGHLVGDELLPLVAQRLRSTLDENCVLSRFGGDEFTVFRMGGASRELATAHAKAAIKAFEKPFELSGQLMRVGASVGVVVESVEQNDFDALLTKADLALYKAKGQGKGQFQLFADELDVDYRYRQRMKADLRECVANNGLYLVYQPIVDRRTHKVAGCEALARWNHPELGAIPPMVFIPIAEEMGLISEISRWVLETATRDCMDWPGDISVSVNISAHDIRMGDVPKMIDEALQKSGLPPTRLEIEVTENMFLEEKGAAVHMLEDLAARGIGIALDDFGTGYSSLSYLHDLPFTKLKIDRTFVVDVTSNTRSLKLLSNIARLSKDLELTVTVEGVETEEQLAAISMHAEVDHIQGYLFGAPL